MLNSIKWTCLLYTIRLSIPLWYSFVKTLVWNYSNLPYSEQISHFGTLFHQGWLPVSIVGGDHAKKPRLFYLLNWVILVHTSCFSPHHVLGPGAKQLWQYSANNVTYSQCLDNVSINPKGNPLLLPTNRREDYARKKLYNWLLFIWLHIIL